uniref:Uncharacterized protein n=1 Tax=viral metagenome TaxID=1070528 RepID=A0A6M3LT49_9ZZZZ
MQFTIKCVKAFLARQGFVYTVRGYKMRDNEIFVKGLGRYKRTFVKEVTAKTDLDKFITCSGFNNTENWWSTILMFCGNHQKWLYLVEEAR